MDQQSSQGVSNRYQHVVATATGPQMSSLPTKEPSVVLPLAASLESTLVLLLRKLGQLLSQQAQLRFQQIKMADVTCTLAASSCDLRFMPGWSELLSAAHKWQRDITALSRWVNRARDALAIEYERARDRDLQREREAESKAAEAEAVAAAQQAIAPTSAPVNVAERAAEDPAVSEAKQSDFASATRGVIDLTEDDDDDVDKLMDGSGKRARQDESAKTAPEEAQSAEDRYKKQRVDDVEGSKTEETRPDVLAPTNDLTLPAAAAEQPGAVSAGASQPRPLDLSFMGLPSLSGVDFAAFMSLDGDGSDGSGGGIAGMGGGDFGAFQVDSGSMAAGVGNSSSALEDADANSGSADTGANFMGNFGYTAYSASENLGGMGLEGTEFSSALQGVDWNSLLQGFDGGQSQSIT